MLRVYMEKYVAETLMCSPSYNQVGRINQLKFIAKNEHMIFIFLHFS